MWFAFGLLSGMVPVPVAVTLPDDPLVAKPLAKPELGFDETRTPDDALLARLVHCGHSETMRLIKRSGFTLEQIDVAMARREDAAHTFEGPVISSTEQFKSKAKMFFN